MTQNTSYKRTPLYDRHVALGAKIVPFGGYEMPITYSRIMEEHLHVRKACGIFDVSHLGEVSIKGREAFPFVQRMIPSDLSKIGDRQILYSVILNEQGGVMDDILVYRENLRELYLVINAGGISKITQHLQKHAPSEVTVANQSEQCACIAIQGPTAVDVVAELFGKAVLDLKYYEFTDLSKLDGSAWISRTGYTGEDGFEVFANPETIVKVWDQLFSVQKKFNLKPIGLAARNTLRLEAGNGLYGTDLNETKTPFEARLGWLISLDKGPFFGKQQLMDRKQVGFPHRLCGFRVNHKAVAREGYPILKNGKSVGIVTSGSFSPTLQYNIGLGYVEKAYAVPGNSIEIEVHGRTVPAEVQKLPFVPLRHK